MIDEIYQFLFLSSITFIVYILFNLFIKVYGRFVLKDEITFKISVIEKIMLWISISLIITYLI